MWTIIFITVLLCGFCVFSTQAIYGGTYIALAGTDGVVMATDSRFSSHQMNAFKIGKYPRNVFRIGSLALLGGLGLESDNFRMAYKLSSLLDQHFDDEVEPDLIARLISNILFEGGYYLTPILAGLSTSGKSFIYSFDGLGALTKSDSFAVVGTSNSALLALFESFYSPDLNCESLCKLTERCIKLAFQRDILSGGDIKIVTLRSDGVYVKSLPFVDV